MACSVSCGYFDHSAVMKFSRRTMAVHLALKERRSMSTCSRKKVNVRLKLRDIRWSEHVRLR